MNKDECCRNCHYLRNQECHKKSPDMDEGYMPRWPWIQDPGMTWCGDWKPNEQSDE